MRLDGPRPEHPAARSRRGVGPIWRRAILLCWSAAAAAAQTPITPEAFLDKMTGRTVTMEMAGTGALVGVERYLDRTRTIWTRPDGTCAFGTVTTPGAKVCFRYDDDPADTLYCWLPFREGATLHVRSLITGEIQRVGRIGVEPLGCEGEPIS